LIFLLIGFPEPHQCTSLQQQQVPNDDNNSQAINISTNQTTNNTTDSELFQLETEVIYYF